MGPSLQVAMGGIPSPGHRRCWRGGDYARIYLKQTLQEELEGLE